MSICAKTLLLCVFVCISTACNAKERIIIQNNDKKNYSEFFVATAEDRESQEKGLMFVKKMPENEGMIFLYPTAYPRKFWMMNTLIPLDILFFDETNRLIHIENSVTPHDLTLRGPDEPVCSVLELNGGSVEKFNIRLGAKLITNLVQECLQSPTE